MPTCPQCQKLIPPGVRCWWRNVPYCSSVCTHAAGDRTACGRECGCTPYAKKRRWLRAHRVELRVVRGLIEEEELEDELEERMFDVTGDAGFWLGDDPEGMDEASDCEDPMIGMHAMRQELDEREGFVQAAKDMLDSRAVKMDMERARMQLEDYRSQGLRQPQP